MASFITLLFAVLTAPFLVDCTIKPNIFIMMADDMGFDDVSIHGSNQIPTPNIDALYAFGIGLRRYYTAPMCTPTRSSLLTGKYPTSVGMQNFVIANYEPWGLGLDQKVLPEYMREAGYATHLVGKWHAGYYESVRTPTKRGYDSFFGCYGGYIDYFNYTCDSLEAGMAKGYDIRDNFAVPLDRIGNYSTDMFTDVALQKVREHDQSRPLFMHVSYTAPHSSNPGQPLQAPAEWVTKMGHIQDEQRRTYAAMVGSLDANIGRFVRGLDEAGMLDNSVIVFIADNGSPVQGLLNNHGSNHPFRGQKNSPWEGATRVAAAIWSPLLQNRERITNQLIHVSDWLPTLGHVAGFEADEPIDGHDQWLSLSEGAADPRSDVLVNYDVYTSYVDGRWKYVNSTTISGTYDGWLSDAYNRTESPADFDYAATVLASDTAQSLERFSELSSYASRKHHANKIRRNAEVTCNDVEMPTDVTLQCQPLLQPCLFNIVDDPCERVNLASKLPGRMAKIQKLAKHYEAIAVPQRNQPIDLRSDPINFNFTWTSWYDVVGPAEETPIIGVIDSENDSTPNDLFSTLSDYLNKINSAFI